MKRVVVIISGDVQGVGYRAWVKREALKLGLSGWVRNRADGSVEAVAEGNREDLEKFIEFCRKGPEVSLVQQITPAWSNATGEFGDFQVVY